MKKFSKLFIAMLLFVSISLPFKALAWDDCPRGEENDPYPGDCRLYVDTDKNGICDLSEKAPEDRETSTTTTNTETRSTDTEESHSEEDHDELMDLISGSDLKNKTVAEIAALYKIDEHKFADELMKNFKFEDVHCSTTFKDLHDKYKYNPSEVKALATAMAKGETYKQTTTQTTTTTAETSNTTAEKETGIMDKYYSIILVLLTFGGYGITWLLVKNKKMQLVTHRKVWNVILLGSFLVTGLLGLLLAILIDRKITVNWYKEILWLHVEFGIIMAVISIFHTVWHWRYYVSMIKKK